MLADHREAGGAAIGFLRLLHQAEARQNPFADPGAIAQIHEDAPASSLRQLSLSFQFALGRLNSAFEKFPDLRLSLEDQAQGVLGNDQQHDFGFGDDRGGLFRAFSAANSPNGSPCRAVPIAYCVPLLHERSSPDPGAPHRAACPRSIPERALSRLHPCA